MRRTIRGRGARGFVEATGPTCSAPEFVQVMSDGGAIVYANDEDTLAERLSVYEAMREAGFFGGRPSPLLSMRRPSE